MTVVPGCFLLAFWMPSFEIPFQLKGGFPVVEGIRIGGSGPYRLVVDTGAQSSSLAPSAARQGRLTANYRVELVRVGRTELAPATASAVVAPASGPAVSIEIIWSAPPPLPGVEGVLGFNFLSNFNFTLDYQSRILTLTPRGTPLPAQPGQRVPFSLVDGRAAIASRGDGRDLLLVLDSGAAHAVLFEPGRDGIVRTLTVGRRRFENLPVVRAVTSYRSADGLFPARFFRSISVDNDSGLLTLR